MQLSVYIKALANPKCRAAAWDAHKKLSQDQSYSLLKTVSALWNFLRYEKVIEFNGSFIVNTFFPPFPGLSFSQIMKGFSKKESEIFQSLKKGKRIAPISCYIALTNTCPYHCWHCSAAHRKNSKDMPKSSVIKIVKELQSMGTPIIGFTGGEPLLRNDLEEILSSIDNRSTTLVFSNGYNLTEKRARSLKKAGLFGIGISLDSYDSEAHDIKRGHKGSFEKAIESMKISIKAGLFTMIQLVASKDLLKDDGLQKILEIGESIGVNEIRILEPIPSGKLINASKDIFLTRDERQQIIDFHKKANSKDYLPIVSTFAQFESKEEFGCSAGVYHCYIDASGNLYPCDFVPLSFGNTLEQPVEKIWKLMNDALGKQPKSACFAQEHHDDFLQSTIDNTFPLSPDNSLKICDKCCSGKNFLPGFFRRLQ